MSYFFYTFPALSFFLFGGNWKLSFLISAVTSNTNNLVFVVPKHAILKISRHQICPRIEGACFTWVKESGAPFLILVADARLIQITSRNNGEILISKICVIKLSRQKCFIAASLCCKHYYSFLQFFVLFWPLPLNLQIKVISSSEVISCLKLSFFHFISFFNLRFFKFFKFFQMI